MKIITLFHNLIRRGGGASLNLFRYTAMVVVLLLGVSDAWANDTYYAELTVTTANTGAGLVYASHQTTTPTDGLYGENAVANDNSSSKGGKVTYYMWAKAKRGSVFASWSKTSGSLTSGPSGGAQNGSVQMTKPSSNGTTTATVQATWTTYSAANVTFQTPNNGGSYTVRYQYTDYNATNKSFDAVDETFIIAEGDASQTKTSYSTDVITLTTDKANFDGWYSDAEFSTKLSDNPTYTYTAPNGGTASVYAKFKGGANFYGKVTASIPDVPYSMPGGGKIYVSAKNEKIESGFSENEQSASAKVVNSDDVPPASVNQTFYLFAQPTDRRYVFRGWFDNAEGEGTALSTSNEYAYTFAVSSKDEATPTEKHVYAIFDFNLYYVEVFAEPTIQGQGMVIVSGEQFSAMPDYTAYSNESSVLTYALRANPKATVYLYAKGKYGYKLAGWYDTPECTGTSLGSANPLEYKPTAESISPLNPTIKKVYAKFVEEDKIYVTYNNPDHTKGEYAAYVLDIAEEDDEYRWSKTVIYTSDGKSANTVQPQYKTDVLMLEAAPKAGYGVTAWTDGSSVASLSQLYTTSATDAKTVGVTFGDSKPFLVSRNSTYYSTLQEAITAANGSGKITVVQNAYVSPGTYTIPSGVTLLVPFDAAGSSYTELSDTYTVHASWSTPTCYSKLTLASGCTINVNNGGAINVAAKQCAPDGGNKGAGCVTSAYGRIDMEAGSNIVVHSGGKLYCWGYITGDGMVTLENGAASWEMFQTYNRGGTAFSNFSSSSEGDKCFPMNQYYIQNIEAYYKVNYGATETVYATLYIQGTKITSGTMIGAGDNGLFALSSGSYLIRKYDPTTDRINYDVYGSGKINHLSIYLYISIDTKNYTLPITNNMTINCHAIGNNTATITVPYRMALLPSAIVSIDKNVTLDISKKLYVYDRDEWVGKSFSYLGTDVTPVSYSPTKTKTRASADLVDAKVIVNGTLKCTGEVYTTSSGASICSSNHDGTAIVHFVSKAGTDENTYQPVQSGSSISRPAIPMTSAKLQNGDGSYEITADVAVAGDKYFYSKNTEKWMRNPKTITWNANGGTTADASTPYSEGAFVGELPAAYKDGHTLEGWYTAADGGTKIDATTKVTANITYYAHWTPKSYSINYRDQGGVAFSGTHIDTPNPHPTTHTYGTATTLNGATKSGYTFGGWYRTPSCSGAVVTSIAASECKNITLYAKWTVKKYNITWKDGTTELRVDKIEYNATPDYGTEPTKEPTPQNTFTFVGWSDGVHTYPKGESLPAVTGDATYIASFDSLTRYYTITWKNWDGDVLETYSGESGNMFYEANPVYGGEDPSREGDAFRTYTFTGWAPEVGKVTKDQDYVAQYSLNISTTTNGEDPENTTVTVSENEVANITTVAVDGELDVHKEVTLSTDVLVLEATPENSGEITGEGTVYANRAHFEYAGVASNFKAKTWYAIAVPWQVNVPAYDKENTGVYILNDGEEPVRQELGTTFDLVYYDGKCRAEKGKDNTCWRYVEDDVKAKQIMYPGRAYMIFLTSDAKKIRFERKEGTDLHTNQVEVATYEAENALPANVNWNGIANPATYKAYLNINGVTENKGFVYNADEKRYEEYDLSQKLVVGQPIYVQTPNAGTVNATRTNTTPSQAQLLAKEQKMPMVRYELMLAPTDAVATDRVIVRMSEDKEEDKYVIGQDLAKMGVSNLVPQMWIERYDATMYIHTAIPYNNTADYPLGISVPYDGEFELFIDEQPNDESMMYLTYNGRVLWNLSYGGYVANLKKGVDSHYGLRVVYSAPANPQGLDETTILNGEAVRKVLVNEQVYIIRNQEMYSITGLKINK